MHGQARIANTVLAEMTTNVMSNYVSWKESWSKKYGNRRQGLGNKMLRVLAKDACYTTKADAKHLSETNTWEKDNSKLVKFWKRYSGTAANERGDRGGHHYQEIKVAECERTSIP